MMMMMMMTTTASYHTLPVKRTSRHASL